MAGGLPIPANHAFHSIQEEAPATFPERESSSTTLKPDRPPFASLRVKSLSYYTVNEVPQPQLRVACGFWNTKPRRIRSSW
jgi:hypothetical protein